MWKWVKRVFPSEHEWAIQQLSAYLDGELSPSARTGVEAHLRECRTCVEELSTLRWTVNLTAQMPMLKAPRSFLITEAIAQPRRTPLGLTYVYLRGATVAVAALLLVVLAGDLLWPYPLSPTMPAPQVAMRKALPAAEEASIEREVIEEMPVEKVVEKEVVLGDEAVEEVPVKKEVIRERPVETVVAEKEVVLGDEAVEEVPVKKEVIRERPVETIVAEKEVRVEKEVEKPTPLTTPEPLAEKAATSLPAATPALDPEVAKSVELEAKQVAPLVAQEFAAPMTPSEERASDRAVGPNESGTEGEQEVPVGAGAVTAVLATPTSTRVLPTATLPLPQRVAEKALPSPQPTPPPPAAAVAEPVERTRDTLPARRSPLRLIEIALGMLMVLLAGSTLILRFRRR
jgi:anti-sigma factor RsiW